MHKNIHPHYWLLGHFRIIASALFILLVFFTGRIAMLLHYGDPSLLSDHLQALMNDLFFGLRFDLKVFAVAMIVPYLIFVLLQVFKPLQSIASRLLFGYCILLVFACIQITLVNYNYYGVYNNHIDVFIFDFFRPGNTSEVSKTIWAQYPVIRLELLALFLTALFYLAQTRFVPRGVQLLGGTSTRPLSITLFMRAITVLLILFLMTAMARGAITARPLSIGRASLSPVNFYNKLAPNGVIALYRAGRSIKSHMSLADPDPESLAKAFNNYFPGREIHSPPQLDDFLTTTTLTETRKKPNVVIAVMESMGARVLTFNSETNNMLGSLAPHAAEDYFFTNFTSAAQSTAQSMEKLLFGHGFNSSISATKYRNLEFATSPAKLFAKQGYRTIFVTAGRKGWENVENFMTLQGFDEIYDEYTILEQVKGARSARTWGVYDEYAFDFVEQKLREQSDKPLFVVILSITNHLPFETPEDYAAKPIDINAVKPFSAITDETEVKDILRTYQYSISALGDFVTDIKTAPSLADETIIAASGDHEIRYLFNSQEKYSSYDYRVPFYLYLPQAYEEGTVKDLQRFGSHRDILPTIYNRIFANTPYFRTGSDLLAEDFDEEQAFSMNIYSLMNSQVCARNYQWGHPDYFAWVDDQYDQQEKLTEEPPEGAALIERVKEYNAFISELTRLQLKASHY